MVGLLGFWSTLILGTKLMAIAASKVKAICSAAEVKLVRASRKGEIEKLTPAEVKRLAAQAKKLADKWHSLGRGQSRARNRKVGFGEADANTQLKGQIFREALEAFQAKLAQPEKLAGGSGKSAAKKSKQDRAAEHRATRAAVRKGMTAVEDLLDESEQPKKKPAKAAKPAAPPQPTPVPRQSAPTKPAPTKSIAQQRPPQQPLLPTKRTPQVPVDPLKQQAAIAAAKQSRIARSGRTTRMAGHVTARVRKAQARRDSKG
jgi:hypothetical protein